MNNHWNLGVGGGGGGGGMEGGVQQGRGIFYFNVTIFLNNIYIYYY